MTDITERLRSRYGATMLDETAAREIEALRAERDRAVTACEQLGKRVAELEALVYVPGLRRCAKCKFQLVQSNLNASTGTVTARDTPGDKCPNCDVPLWRVTERQAGDEMVDRCEAEILRAAELEAALRPFAEAYRNAKVQGAPCAALLAGEEKGRARVGDFWRAAELVPPQDSNRQSGQ